MPFGTTLSSGLDPMKKPVGLSAALDPMNDDEEGGGGPGRGMIAEAITTSRAATLEQDPTAPRVKSSGRRVAQAGKEIWLWSPWVRGEVFRGEVQSRFLLVGDSLHARVSDGSTAPVVTIRRPAESVFASQALEVISRATARPDRLAEICTQASTLWPFWSAVTHITPATCPKTVELISAALTSCSALMMSLKHGVAAPRPADYSPHIHPVVATPGHGSMPSGHAAAAHFFLTLTDALFGWGHAHPVYKQLSALATRIADNRVVAGLHFPIDSNAGELAGTVLADYLVSCATASARSIGNAIFETPQGATLPAVTRAPSSGTALPSPVIGAMWQAASAELDMLGMRP